MGWGQFDIFFLPFVEDSGFLDEDLILQIETIGLKLQLTIILNLESPIQIPNPITIQINFIIIIEFVPKFLKAHQLLLLLLLNFLELVKLLPNGLIHEFKIRENCRLHWQLIGVLDELVEQGFIFF